MLRKLGLFALLCLLVPISTPADDSPSALALGDPLPPLRQVTWLTDQPLPLDLKGQTTVLEFWATWSPVSRITLGNQNDNPRDNVQYVAISQESSSALKHFIERAGWSNLIIGSDADRHLLATIYDPTAAASREFPYALIIGDDPTHGPGTLLWTGPVNNPQADIPSGAFATALAEIIGGTYDLAVAQETAREQAITLGLLQELTTLTFNLDPDRLPSILTEFEENPSRRGDPGDFARKMNSIAWDAATHENISEQLLLIADRAISLALSAGGDRDPNTIDTQARVLWEQGKRNEAVAVQTRAVEMSHGTPNHASLLNTLQSYLAELQLPPYEIPTPEGELPSATFWSGNLNATGDARADNPENILIVRPEIPADEELAAAWDSSMELVMGRIFQNSLQHVASEVEQSAFADQVAVLYGAPSANRWVADILERNDIALAADGLRVGEEWLPVENPVLIACFPNPWAPELPLSVYTAFREEDALNLNSFFHGPTSMMLGRWSDGNPRTVLAVDWSQTTNADGTILCGLNLPPKRLTGAQAREDLLTMHEQLALGYAGYEDINWDLQMEGSSWSGRNTEFLKRIDSRGSIAWDDYYNLLLEYLAPVADTHFTIRGFNPVASRNTGARLVKAHVPLFSDLKIERRGDSFFIASAPPELARHIGDEIADLPLIDSPHTLRVGEPYLFPTLPIVDDPARATRFLLGVIDLRNDPPASVSVSIKSNDKRRRGGKKLKLDLPLHRGRVRLENIDRSAGHWTQSVAPDGVTPVLGVRSMDVRRLDGLPATADTLRNEPAMVLDLRGNYGGGDDPAMLWGPRLSGQYFEWVGYVVSYTGQSDPLRRYRSFPGSRMNTDPQTEAATPYGGSLKVLIDRGVASSGETFTHVASQIIGAVLLGENSSGCVNYGNVTPHAPLPHSGLKLNFGRSRFVADWVRPTREGIGFFPDYWLDTEDPIGLLYPGKP
ncbi:MAG: hypothetical protein GY835_27050 [bacterium]|nr:hypothetical protein [bacterium]